MSSSSSVTGQNNYDVLVIGGGVVGCAIFYQLSRHGYRCCLVEKEKDLMSGASSGNSGILHTGFDAVEGSIEFECLQKMSNIETACSEFQIPLKKIGAIMIAQTDDELNRLDEIAKRSRKTGISDTRRLTKTEIIEMEPNLNEDLIHGGLLINGEAVLDSWLLPVTLAHQAIRNGAKVEMDCKIISGKRLNNDQLWHLRSTKDLLLTAAVVVNAAGLYGDELEEICQPSNFTIKPRKGQFVVYGKESGHLINHIILPVPSDLSKGVLIYPSVYGNLVIGPTAEECSEKENAFLSKNVTQRLIDYGRKMIPSLEKHKIVNVYAGIRPATETKDYHLTINRDRKWITVGGIRSTGLSSCLSIAGKVLDFLNELDSSPTKVPPKQHDHRRPTWTASGNSGIIMDGVHYSITHPLTRLGLEQHLSSKL